LYHCLGGENKGVLVAPASFRLAGRFVRIAPEGGAGLSGEFRAAAFDEVAGFGDDVLQDFENLAHTGFVVDEFRKGFEK